MGILVLTALALHIRFSWRAIPTERIAISMICIDEEKANRAIQDCLKFCHGTNDVILKLAEYLEKLHATGDWNKEELWTVELGVLHVLRGIIGDQKQPSEAAERRVAPSIASFRNRPK